jgi:hypothetical protein
MRKDNADIFAIVDNDDADVSFLRRVSEVAPALEN